MSTTGSEATVKVRIALLLIVLFFGGSLPAYKLASESFGPATTNLIRFTIAAAMLTIAGVRHWPRDRHARFRLFLVGAAGIGVMALLMGIGVDRGSAIIGSVVVGLEPIGVALAGVLMVGDRPSVRSMVALVIGTIGALIASGIFTERTGPSPVLPVLLLFGTVVTFSLYTGWVRRVGAGVHPFGIASITQLGALTFVIPATLLDVFDRGMVRGDVTPKALLASIFLGVGSGIAYLMLVLVLADQPSNRVAVTLFLTPVIGVLLSWIVVGEALRWRHAVGAATVLAAVWVSERGAATLAARRASPAPT